MEGVTCRNVPVFAALRDSGKHFAAPAEIYGVKIFSHGLDYADMGAVPEIETRFDAAPLTGRRRRSLRIWPNCRPCDTWVNLRDLGAKRRRSNRRHCRVAESN